MRILKEQDMLEMTRGQEKQFLYSSARVRCISLFSYEFFSYKTPMLKAIAANDGWVIEKTSEYRSVTTLQHLRKFFNMIGRPDGYYTYKHSRAGDIISLY